jgi:hypothetical protein
MGCTVNILDQTRLLDDFVAALAEMPETRVLGTADEVEFGNQRFDRVIDVRLKGRDIRLVIEAKSSGYPRDVQSAAARLLAMRSSATGVVPIVVAPALSAGSREVLQRMGIGYWDRGGSLYLDGPSVLFWIDRPVPTTETRRIGSVYRGRRAQVLHALLLDPFQEWHIDVLARRAEVAPSTVHQTLTFLEDQLWVEKRGSGPQAVRLLREPGKVLDAWALEHSLSRYRPHRYHRWVQRPEDLLDETAAALDGAGVDHALTLESGAQVVAPFATGESRLTLLAADSPKIDNVMRAQGFGQVEGGENVLILTTRERSPLMFQQRVQGARIVSDIQLYLDLFASPRRGKEQAQHLRAQRIRF